MAKIIDRGWSKPGDEIPQPVGVLLGGNLRINSKPQSPPKPKRQLSPMQLEECERLVAEIKKHHPQGE